MLEICLKYFLSYLLLLFEIDRKVLLRGYNTYGDFGILLQGKLEPGDNTERGLNAIEMRAIGSNTIRNGSITLQINFRS